MAEEIITKEDLRAFWTELLNDLIKILDGPQTKEKRIGSKWGGM